MLERLSRSDPAATYYVGGCRGGDCLAASYLFEMGRKVHTILPTITTQLCFHWQIYLEDWDLLVGSEIAPPHTTTWGQMAPSAQEPYRDRNTMIVGRGMDLLLAFPARQEQEARSGTTMTINIARRAGVPVDVTILHAGVSPTPGRVRIGG